MPGRSIKLWGCRALLTATGILALACLNTVASASTTVPVARVELRAVIAASHAPVPAAGGQILVHIKVLGAQSCRVQVLPPIHISPRQGECHGLENTYRATVGLNPQLRQRQFVLSVIAEGPHGQITRRLVIHQLRAPNRVDNFTRVNAYGIYGNGQSDAVGDCTLATAADLLQTWDAKSGLANGPLATQPFLDAYHTLVGGPGGPNIGLTAREVLNYWQHTGIDNNLISSWHLITAYRNPALIEAALAHSGALYASVALPNTDTNFLPLWTMANSPYGTPVAGGHALAIVGYDARGPYFATWGGVQHATWQWWRTWGTGAYVVRPGSHPWTPNVVHITSTTLSETVGTTIVNGASAFALNLVATVSGVAGPTSATVSFSDNGQPIAGCATLRAIPAGTALTATCTEYFSLLTFQSDTLFAEFSGDANFGDSTSNAGFVTFN